MVFVYGFYMPFTKYPLINPQYPHSYPHLKPLKTTAFQYYFHNIHILNFNSIRHINKIY